MDWKINPSIRVALKTWSTLHLEIHEQQLANGCCAWAGSTHRVWSVWHGPCASMSWASLPPSMDGWGAFSTNRSGTFLVSGKDVTCTCSPSWIQASNATNSDLCSCWSHHLAGLLIMGLLLSDGLNMLRSGQFRQTVMQTALHAWKHYKSDESWLTPLLTPLKEDSALYNPKNVLFLIQAKLLVLVGFFLLVNGWFITTYRNALCPSLSLHSSLSHKQIRVVGGSLFDIKAPYASLNLTRGSRNYW